MRPNHSHKHIHTHKVLTIQSNGRVSQLRLIHTFGRLRQHQQLPISPLLDHFWRQIRARKFGGSFGASFQLASGVQINELPSFTQANDAAMYMYMFMYLYKFSIRTDAQAVVAAVLCVCMYLHTIYTCLYICTHLSGKGLTLET